MGCTEPRSPPVACFVAPPFFASCRDGGRARVRSVEQLSGIAEESNEKKDQRIA